MSPELTVVFGYSENIGRYSYKAAALLTQFEHNVFKFNPRIDDPKIIPREFHTLTMYVNEDIANKFLDEIIKLKFKRIIFNPGTNCSALEKWCLEQKIEVVHGCTLVMLNTDQY